MNFPDKFKEKHIPSKRNFINSWRFERSEESCPKATVIFDDKGIVVFWSKIAEKIFGWTTEEAVGKPASFILYKQFAEVFKVEVIDPALSNKSIRTAEYTILVGIKKDGKKIRLSISVDSWSVENRTFSVVYFSEVTKSNKNERLPEILNVDLLKLMEKNVFEGIAIVDKNGMVLYMNHATEVLLNRKSEDLIGNYFGLPLVPEKYINIEIIKPDRSIRNVEMRSVEVMYRNEETFFISLRDVTEKEILKAKLEELAFRDKLTGLLNRSGFMFLAEQQIKYAKRIHYDSCTCEMTDVALLFIDVDGLKYINDNFGHKKGDYLLRTVADLLTSTFREADIVGRLGGDEFVVFAITTDADCLLGRLSKNLDAYNNGKGKDSEPVSFSVGMALYDFKSSGTVTDLIGEADKLMYEQKRSKHKDRQN